MVVVVIPIMIIVVTIPLVIVAAMAMLVFVVAIVAIVVIIVMILVAGPLGIIPRIVANSALLDGGSLGGVLGSAGAFRAADEQTECVKGRISEMLQELDQSVEGGRREV